MSSEQKQQQQKQQQQQAGQSAEAKLKTAVDKPRLQAKVLKASSPAFTPSPTKAQPKSSAANTAGSPLKLAPAFTPRKQQQKPSGDVKPAQAAAESSASSGEVPALQKALSRMDIKSKQLGGKPKSAAEDHDLFFKHATNTSQSTYMKPVGYFAIDEKLRRVLADEARQQNMVVESDLPFQIHNYYSLTPEETVVVYELSGGVTMQLIKGQSITDGRHYSLHRVTSTRLPGHIALGAVEKWKQVQNPSIAQVHEAFTTRAFGDNSLIVVHDYKPTTVSLKSMYVDQSAAISEAFLWSTVLQLASALRAVHSAGLAVHTLSVSTVAVSATRRVYINSGGLADILSLGDSININTAQQNDLHAIGGILGVLLGLSTENMVMQGQMATVVPGVSFSTDFKELFSYLNRRLTPVIAVDDILRLAGSRVFYELDAVRRESDLLHDSLRLEMNNGRLVRLLCKMNFVTERLDHDMDSEWSETGERYLVKLFRDYVFHLVDEQGRPVADMAHVVGNLNKLDAGSAEKVMLMSRDEKSCLVVSYGELKRCIDDSYTELMTAPKLWK